MGWGSGCGYYAVCGLMIFRSVRESFIRAKYVQHAFVHPHPNFERPEIPVPPLSIPDLLTPSKSPLTASLGSSSPRSPGNKRSFSPSVKRRSPRSLTGSLRLPYRPASTSSSINPSDRSTPVDSEDDLPPRSDFATTVDPSSSSMQLLAENLKKLERSGKLKNWGNFNLGDKLGDKIKSAKRSSKKITGYALSKLGGQGTILRRGKRSKSKEGVREVHSDTEDGDDLSTSSTPLLQSMSASTHNLSISSVPPPKPPRTFKTKVLGQGYCDKEEDEKDDLLKMCEDDFSLDVLNALKQVGSVIDEGGVQEGEEPLSKSESMVMTNGLLPSERSGDLEPSLVKRSESSPLLMHLSLPPTQEEDLKRSSPDLLQRSSHSIGLQPIAEAKSETLDTTDGDRGVRLVSSVPLRRKACPAPPTASLPQSYLAGYEAKASAVGEDDDEDLRKFMDDSNSRADKRLSMMSTTSADFYSAASSEANSTAASPDFLRHGILTPPSAGAPIINVDDDNTLRVTSSMSAEEEYFSTPPSSPNPVDQSDKMEVDKTDKMDGNQGDNTEDNQSNKKTVDQGEEVEGNQADKMEDNEGDKITVDKADKIEGSGTDKIEDNRADKMEGNGADKTEGNEADEMEGSVADSAEVTEVDVESEVTEKLATELTASTSTAAASEEEGGNDVVHTASLSKDGRKRSLTVSESMSFPVSPGGSGSRGMIKTMSKDDNYQTEYQHLLKSNDDVTDSGTLAVSFSTQDLADIFGGARSSLPEPDIEPVMEEQSGTEVERRGEEEEEGREQKGDGESVSMADHSASPTCSSLGGSTSPEIIEPVIIPSDITPDVVRVATECIDLANY